MDETRAVRKNTMGSTRQLAGVGGLVVGALLILTAVHQLVLYPTAGFRTGGDSPDFYDPAKVFGSLWVFQVGDLLNILLGFALASENQRMRRWIPSPTRTKSS